MASDTLNNTLFTGKFLIHEPMLPSTNQFAHELISKTKPIDGTVIITDFQSAGKGQGGNTWNAASGMNITCSVIYDTSFLESKQPYFLNMAVANSLIELLSHYLPYDQLSIKWPNDILVSGKKIAGILIENTVMGSHLKHSIIGIGLNVNQASFEHLPNATSMLIEQPGERDLRDVLERMCVALEQAFLQLKKGDRESIRIVYNQRLFMKDKTVVWELEGKGISAVVIEVNSFGQLIASVNGQKRTFNHGDFVWRLG